jgi:peptide/nickel transport system permease protein
MNWILLRTGRALLTLLLLIGFSFFVLSVSGDPALSHLSADVDASAIDAFRRKWGLDLPLWQQFLIYLRGLAHGDFGMSYATGRPALEQIMAGMPVTVSLMLPTIFAAIGFGLPLGAFAAMRRGSTADCLTITLSVLALAVPNFLLGLMLMYVFSVHLGWIEPSGIVDWRSYLMPVATMALPMAAIFARFTRSAMLEILSHPMLDTARAGGLQPGRIKRAHVLPNIAVPLVTITALEFGHLFTAAVVAESVFGWPGTGRLLIDSVASRDFAVVQAILLLTGTTMILANLLADIAYGAIDPRVRDQRRRRIKA